ncbi:MAG: 2TM domain-containing protein [Ilumatobacter sp.]|nr:2TM domain-containing protein [Ilumatobacter sp.]
MDQHDTRRSAAIARITDKRDFRTHALLYFAVNALLVVIWAASGVGYFWPIWPIAGWGIGVVLHAWNVFGQKPISETEIAEEMHRLDGPPSRSTR